MAIRLLSGARQAEAAENTLRSIAEEFLAREGKRHRSYHQHRRVLERLVYPSLGGRQIDDIRRSDVVRLLDRIADENGPRMADTTLAFIRRIMNWHASRSDDFRSPIVRGMARTKPSQRRRQRILSDDELRAIWRAAEAQPSAFGRLVQFLLLTAARRTEAARMELSEVSRHRMDDPAGPVQDRAWNCWYRYRAPHKPFSPRHPGSAAGFAFTNDGRRPLSGFPRASQLRRTMRHDGLDAA